MALLTQRLTLFRELFIALFRKRLTNDPGDRPLALEAREVFVTRACKQLDEYFEESRDGAHL
jgi:hypothetical protein